MWSMPLMNEPTIRTQVTIAAGLRTMSRKPSQNPDRMFPDSGSSSSSWGCTASATASTAGLRTVKNP